VLCSIFILYQANTTIIIKQTKTKWRVLKMEKTYNGWANYETWVVKLWMDNDQGLYNYINEEVKNYKDDISGLAGWLESTMMETMPENVAGWVSDLLNSSFERIDWVEVAQSLLEG
jgi:hypothetical protein